MKTNKVLILSLLAGISGQALATDSYVMRVPYQKVSSQSVAGNVVSGNSGTGGEIDLGETEEEVVVANACTVPVPDAYSAAYTWDNNESYFAYGGDINGNEIDFRGDMVDGAAWTNIDVDKDVKLTFQYLADNNYGGDYGYDRISISKNSRNFQYSSNDGNVIIQYFMTGEGQGLPNLPGKINKGDNLHFYVHADSSTVEFFFNNTSYGSVSFDKSNGLSFYTVGSSDYAAPVIKVLTNACTD